MIYNRESSKEKVTLKQPKANKEDSNVDNWLAEEENKKIYKLQTNESCIVCMEAQRTKSSISQCYKCQIVENVQSICCKRQQEVQQTNQ